MHLSWFVCTSVQLWYVDCTSVMLCLYISTYVMSSEHLSCFISIVVHLSRVVCTSVHTLQQEEHVIGIIILLPATSETYLAPPSLHFKTASVHLYIYHILAIHLNICYVLSIHLYICHFLSIHIFIWHALSVHLCICHFVTVYLYLCHFFLYICTSVMLCLHIWTYFIFCLYISTSVVFCLYTCTYVRYFCTSVCLSFCTVQGFMKLLEYIEVIDFKLLFSFWQMIENYFNIVLFYSFSFFLSWLKPHILLKFFLNPVYSETKNKYAKVGW